MDQSNPSINSDTPEDYGFLERFKTLGILIVVLMYVLVIVFYFLKINTNFNPPNLIFILNLIFVFIPNVSYSIYRSKKLFKHRKLVCFMGGCWYTFIWASCSIELFDINVCTYKCKRQQLFPLL